MNLDNHRGALIALLIATVPCARALANNVFNSPDKLCPNDEGVIFGSFCPAPAQRQLFGLTFESVRGGASLSVVTCWETDHSYSCVVRAGPNPGLVRATLSASDGRNYSALIEIGGGNGCESCQTPGGRMPIGSENVSVVDGPFVEMAIGEVQTQWYEPTHTVRLAIMATQPSAVLATPDALEILGLPNWCRYQSSGNDCDVCDPRFAVPGCTPSDCPSGYENVFLWVRPVVSGDNIAIVRTAVAPDTGYYVDVAASSPYTTGSGCCCVTPPDPADLLVRWHIWAPSGDPNQLVVQRLSPLLVEQATYYFHCLDGARNWQLTTSVGLAAAEARRETVVWTYDQPTSQWKRTYTVELNGTSGWYTSSVRDTYHASQDAQWTTEILDPDGDDPQITEREFYDASAGVFEGAPKWQTNPDGSWAWYTYEDLTSWYRRRITTYRSTWTDEPLPETISNWGTYDQVVLQHHNTGDDTPAGLLVASQTRQIQGQLVEKFISQQDGADARLERRYFTADGYLQTTVTYAPDQNPPDPAAGDVFDVWSDHPWIQRIYPTGVVESRSEGGVGYPYSFNPSTWSVSFIWPWQVWHAVTISPNAPKTYQYEITDPDGRLLFTGSRWLADGDPGNNPATEWTFFEYDDLHRVTAEYYSNWTKKTTVWEDCCRSRIVTDADGVQTRYEHDAAGRPTFEVRMIPPTDQQKREITEFEYAAVAHAGRTLPAVTVKRGYDAVATVEAPVDTFQVLRTTRTIYDLAGRVVAEVDLDAGGAELLKTIYAYGSAPGGGRQITITRPDLQTEIRSYHRDSQLESVTGTGVVPTYCEYSVAAGELTTTVHTDGPSSPRYVATTRDMLGRVKREVRPGWALTGNETLTTTYTYDGAGDLRKVETRNAQNALVAAPELHEYAREINQLIQRSGIEPSDITADGTFQPNSDDRYTEVISSAETTGSLTYRVKTTKTYEAGGAERVLAVDRDLVRGFNTVPIPPGGTGKVIGYRKSQDERGDEITQTTMLDEVTRTRKEHSKHTDWLNYAVETWQYGRRTASLSRTGVQTNYEYDGIGRETFASDGRTVTKTTYNAIGRVSTVADAADRTTQYLYYLQDDLGAGQVMQVNDLLGKHTYYAYDELARVKYTWGDTPQPTWIQYTPYGERRRLHTYRSPDTGWNGSGWPGVGDGDVTQWNYDEATGLLEEKVYADGTAVDYEYTADGQLYLRKWARSGANGRVTTTYGRDPRTSEVLTITYNYGTPNVTLTYDRRGRVDSVTQSGTYGLSYDYDYSQWPTSVTVTTSGLYAKTLTQVFDPNDGGQLTEQSIAGEYGADYFYNRNTGRLERVGGPGLPAGGSTSGANYGYISANDLVASISYKNSAGTELLKTDRAYESIRDIVTKVTHTWKQGTPTTLALYDYRDPGNQAVAGDNLGRRTNLAYSGLAFPQALTSGFGYNGRDELTSATQTGGPAAGNWTYEYDPIGNRKTHTNNGLAVSYLTNALNQYARWDRPGGTVARERYEYDADGNLAQSYVAGDMNCDGVVDFGDLNLFTEAVTCAYTYPICCEQCWLSHGHTCPYLNADINGDGTVSFADITPFATLQQTHNAAAARRYTWDAENRLVTVQPTLGTEQDGQFKVDFAYDYQGRRVRKEVTVWDHTLNQGNGDWSSDPLKGAYVRKFVWQDWLMLAELDDTNAAVRQYTWGLDLAGLGGTVNDRQSAGGIGGLLAVHQAAVAGVPAGDYVYCYDALGNVGQAVDLAANSASASLVARYEYDPYGNVVGPDTDGDGTFDASDSPGPYTAQNPMRFSTKYWDDETGLGYLASRFYGAAIGRFVNRDPINEVGFVLLHQLGGREFMFPRPTVAPGSVLVPHMRTTRFPVRDHAVAEQEAAAHRRLIMAHATCEPDGRCEYSLLSAASLVQDEVPDDTEFNLYQYVQNEPTDSVDSYGLSTKCGTRYCMCSKKGGRPVTVHGNSRRAKAILEARYGKGTTGCVTLLNWFGTGAEIYCTGDCKEIKRWKSGNVPTLDHECCHACDYFDNGVCRYLQGAVKDNCNSRPKGGFERW